MGDKFKIYIRKDHVTFGFTASVNATGRIARAWNLYNREIFIKLFSLAIARRLSLRCLEKKIFEIL